MADLELLISRYLDGELNPAEHLRLQKILSESAEARALLREMSALARAARRSPLLHGPPSHLESLLFARLREEGLHHPAVPETVAPPAVARERRFGARSIRTAMAGVALLAAFIGDSYFVNRGTIRVGSPVAASAVAYVARVEIDSGASVASPSLRVPLSGARSLARRGVVPSGELRAPVAQVPPGVIQPPPPSVPEHLPEQEPRQALAQVAPRHPIDTFSIPVDQAVSAQAASVRERSDAEVGDSRLAASFRPGIAMIERRERAITREVNFQLGMELKGGHQLSLIVGTAPAVTETRYENAFGKRSAAALASTPNENARTETDVVSHDRSHSLPDYELHLRNEAWVGIGYNYSVTPIRGVSIGVGVNAGASASAWRVGGELPIRYALMKSISIEGALSVSNFNPRNHDVDRSVVSDTPDHFVYNTSVEHPSFVSYGVQLGIRVDLAGNR